MTRFAVAFLLLTTAAWADDQVTAKPPSPKETSKRQRRARRELESAYNKWLDEDVAYIITDAERRVWHRLQNDDEREQFIEEFWRRRDPTPDTEENEFKEEHYRRIAYANEHYTSGLPGWKTDRGRIYITYGPPDEIEAHPSGGQYQVEPQDGGGQMTTYPFERWRYRYIENVGTNVVVEFVDPSMTGEYHMTMDPQEKNALAHVPGGQYNSLLPQAVQKSQEFDRLDLWGKLNRPPAAPKFPDLQAAVDSHVSYNLLPVKVRVDYVPLTQSSVLTNVTVQLDNHDLGFRSGHGVPQAVVNLYARVTNMTRRIVSVFEDTVTADTSAGRSVYQKSVPLAPGTYRLNLVCKDVLTGAMNTYESALNVPRLEAGQPGASSLIVADLIEKVPAREIGSGPFVIGDSRVRPRVDSTFHRDERLGLYLQLYSLVSGDIEYQVTRNGTNERVLSFTEPLGKGGVTIEKTISLHGFSPGEYTLELTITDRPTQKRVVRTAVFTVL